ncbi:HIT-type Zinc finger family protein [Actinidia rufa]|uniref:HIT-type Zinc finger family protein n=1 Tax=Actinidia rufa TaxID=165716 RepID=A0A7J0GRL2_9ERIC|nr:HIT-type Zinc finger family protein [Actinidia rufa]
MDEDTSNPLRRMSSRTRKVASKMVAALASSDNRTQAALARLEALENDNAGMEMVEINSDDDASLDDEDQGLFELFLFSVFQLVYHFNF